MSSQQQGAEGYDNLIGRDDEMIEQTGKDTAKKVNLSGREKQPLKVESSVACPDNLSQPKANTCIKFKTTEGKQWRQAKILSRQPKRKGRNSDWVNVQIEGEHTPCSVNWKEVGEWQPIENTENMIFLSELDEMNQQTVDAKEKELQNMIDNDVFETVAYHGQPTVSCKWVFTEKYKDGVRVVKARFSRQRV